MIRSEKTMRFALLLIAVSAVVFPCCSFAYPQDPQTQQNQSVADAARQAREAKKNAAKPTKVISDDDIDTRSVKPGAQGLDVGSQPKSDSEPPSAAAVAADETADAAKAAAESNPPVTAGEDREIARAKEQVVEANTELDLLKRSFALDQDTYYSKPGYTDDHEGKSKLDAEQQQLNDKQQAVDALKAHLAELEAAYKKKRPAADEATAAPDAAKPAPTPEVAPPQR